MTEDDAAFSRRTLLRAVGVTVTASIGAVGSAAAVQCVAATHNAQGYDSCPSPSPTMWAAEGKPGLVVDTCWDGGVEYKKVDYCDYRLWIEASDLVPADDCYC